MKFPYQAVAAAISFALSSVFVPAVANTQAEAQPTPQTIEPEIVYSALDKVQEMINDWKDSPEGDLWLEQTELCDLGEACLQIFEGVATAKGDISSPEFGEVRSLAFTQALQKAQGDNARAQFMENSGSILGSLSYGAPEFDDQICQDLGLDDRVDALIDKGLVLADQMLTNKMKEEGVPEEEIPEKVASIRKQDRQKMLEDAISQQATQSSKATQGAGFVVLKNYEAVDKNNQSAVGVIVVSAPRIMQLLRAMKESKGQFNPEVYEPIGMLPQLDQSVRKYVKSSLKDNFGARLVYNRQGIPTIIGIGQASQISATNDPKAASVYKRIAQESAQQNAINAITQMFDMQTQVSVSITDEARFTQYAIAEYVGCNLDSVDDNQPIQTSYDKFLKVTEKSTFKTKLVGTKQVRRDSYYHPALKRKIYYAAYEWSPATEKGIKNYQQAIKKELPKKKTAPPQPATKTSDSKPAEQFGGYSSESPTSMTPDF